MRGELSEWVNACTREKNKLNRTVEDIVHDPSTHGREKGGREKGGRAAPLVIAQKTLVEAGGGGGKRGYDHGRRETNGVGQKKKEGRRQGRLYTLCEHAGVDVFEELGNSLLQAVEGDGDLLAIVAANGNDVLGLHVARADLNAQGCAL